jgi:hypothetical protein
MTMRQSVRQRRMQVLFCGLELIKAGDTSVPSSLLLLVPLHVVKRSDLKRPPLWIGQSLHMDVGWWSWRMGGMFPATATTNG